MKFKSVDSILIDRPVSDEILQQAIDSVLKEKNPRLRTTIDATHSGVLTNLRVYPGKFVSVGYKSFTSKENGGTADFNKPVLKHHDSYGDAIGRIVGANFTKVKQGKAFDEDYLSPDPVGGKGSGIVTITADIPDPESIQKIIDGRYLSVSSGHETDSMTCSVCEKSIMKCDHWPGKYYDTEGEETDAENGFLCFYITGNMNYTEVSFVNMPAQPPARLVNFKWEDFQKDKFQKENSLLIQSMIRGKKSMVRDMTLTDEDGEYNLIKGIYVKSGNKTVIAMKPQAKTDLEIEKETIDVPLTKQKDPSGNAKIANDTSNKGNKTMETDKNKEDGGLDVKTLQASLQAVTEAKDKLGKEKAAVDKKLGEVEATLAAKVSEIERLTKTVTDTQTELCGALATALTSFRIKLQKPGTEDLSDSEKFNEYVKKLSERSAGSLKDSINDIVQELKNLKPEEGVDSKEKLNLGKKVANPLPVDSKNKIVVAGNETPSKTTENKNTIDKLFD